MKCPYCGGEMVPGTAVVRGTTLGFLLFGFSEQHLWFRKVSGGRDEKIVPSSGERAGYQCTECRAVIIQGDEEPRR